MRQNNENPYQESMIFRIARPPQLFHLLFETDDMLRHDEVGSQPDEILYQINEFSGNPLSVWL